MAWVSLVRGLVLSRRFHHVLRSRLQAIAPPRARGFVFVEIVARQLVWSVVAVGSVWVRCACVSLVVEMRRLVLASSRQWADEEGESTLTGQSGRPRMLRQAFG